MRPAKLLSIFVIMMMVVSGLGMIGMGDLISGVFSQSYSRSGDDSYEENDNSSAAAIITVGTHTNLQCLDDDWYKIRMLATQDLTVTIQFNNSIGDLDLELYSTDATTLLSESGSDTNAEIVTMSSIPAPGLYYIRVFGYGTANNSYDMTLSTTDITPPKISNVIVTWKSDNRVILEWGTDEPAASELVWGKKAGSFPDNKSNAGYTKNHLVTLTGLDSYSTYNYKVICKDRAGNSAERGPHYFRTNATADTINPEVELIVPDYIEGSTLVRARATDNNAVAKVEFYVDGVYQHTDYSAEPSFRFDDPPQPKTGYMFIARAVDKAGNVGTHQKWVVFNKTVPDRTPPDVEITSKFKKDTVRGRNVELNADIIDPDSGVDKIVFYVNGEHKWTSIIDGNTGGNEPFDFIWNTYGANNDEWNMVSFEAYNKEGLSASSSVDIFVDNPTDTLPSDQGPMEVTPVDVTRGQVKREGTWYEVKLKVKNIGSKELYDVHVEDVSFGFQTVSSEYGYEQKASYDPSTRETSIKFPIGDLKPGETKTIVYNMVPVLFAPDPRVDFTIGKRTVVRFLKSPGDLIAKKATFYAQAVEMIPGWWDVNTVPITDQNILAPLITRDYLVVTHPGNLYYQYQDSQTSELLSDMALFSREKNAVLGYLTQYGGDMVNELKNAINPLHWLDWNTWTMTSGGWNYYISPDWEYNGYLLIVGEGEIVPAVDYLLYVWSDTDLEFKENYIPKSDHYYSDLVGDGGPDVVVGRLIGDSPAVLRKAIDTSMGVHKIKSGYDFDGSDALLISGIGNYYPSFQSQVNTIGDSLSSKGVNELREHREDHVVLEEFTTVISNNDVVCVDNVGGLYHAEIVLADESSDRIEIYNGDGIQMTYFYHDFDPGDLMAVGDVTGDDRAEIIIADISHNKIYIYKAYYSVNNNLVLWDKGLLKTYSLTLDYDDKMAVGDVRGDSKKDIVISDDSANQLVMISFSGSSLVINFVSVPVPDPHGLAVGDVVAGGKDEIVIAEDALIIHLAHIYVYDSNGNQVGKFGSYFNEPEDRIAIGDTWGNNDQDIIIKNKRDSTLYFYYVNSNTDWNDPYEEWTHLYFDFSNADDLAVGQLVSGDNIEILISNASANKMFYYNTHWSGRFKQAFHSDSPGKDIIYMAVHGGPQVWGSGVKMDNLPTDFGGTNPFVVAFSCSTGLYEWMDDDDAFHDDGIAEAFFESGAGVYIGATRMTNTGTNSELGRTYFDSFYDPLLTVGRSYTDLERHGWSVLAFTSDSGLGFWREILAYNIYGDPKFKPESNNNIPQIDKIKFKYWELEDLRGFPGGSAASLNMKVPDYEVSEVDDKDYVDIPGGNILLARDHYRVPYYFEAVEIPDGYQVQDVKLTNRANLNTVRGLELSTVLMQDIVSGDPFGDAPGPNIEPGQEWYPYDDFRWTVSRNANGTSTLYITVYPFLYNQKTLDARFYTDFQFSIDFIQSDVELTNIRVEKQVYDFTEPVNIDITFENSGTATKNVIVSTEIVSYSSRETISGLELQSLGLHAGSSSTTLILNPRDMEGGHYEARVTVMDLSGNVLDTEIVSFLIGVTEGEIRGLALSSTFYEDGDPVLIDFEFPNTGSMMINGIAVISVKDENGNVAAEFNQSIRNLSSSEVATIEATWDTTGAEGKYFVTARVYYDGKVALSEVIELNDYASAIGNIIDDLDELNPPGGLKNSLQSKLDNTIKLIDLGKPGPAANLLEAFVNEVEAQRGKIFNDVEADELVESVGKILDGLKKAGG